MLLVCGSAPISGGGWCFFSQLGNVKVLEYDDVFPSLLPLCDGSLYASQILESLSKNHDSRRLRTLLEHLVTAKILVESHRLYEGLIDYFYPGCMHEKLLSQEDVERVAASPSLPPINSSRFYPAQLSKNPLAAMAATRRTTYAFSPKMLSQPDINNLLWSMYGVQGAYDDRFPKTTLTIPSGGALYGLRVDVFLYRSTDCLSAGHYLWRPIDNGLELLSEGIDKSFVSDFFNPHMNCENAFGVVVVSANLTRLACKYGNKAFILAYLEAGHAMQNAYLYASLANIGFAEILGFQRSLVESKINRGGMEYRSLISGVFGAR